MKIQLFVCALVGTLLLAVISSNIPALSLFSSAHAQDAVSTLEKLLLDKQYKAFALAAEQAAEKGDVDALFLLGKSYHMGWGVDEDEDEAVRYYLRAAELGSARAWHNLGLIQKKNGRFGDAKASLERALSLGLKKPTLYNLGSLHLSFVKENGSNMTPGFACKTLHDAGEYLEQSYSLLPEQEDSTLEMLVGAHLWVYRIGDVDPLCDKSMALKELTNWLDVSLAKELPWAYYDRGDLLYKDGKVAESIPWFQKAAERNDADAAYLLGSIYHEGRAGVLPNEPEALRWLKIASVGGSNEAKSLTKKILQAQLEQANTIADLEKLVNDISSVTKKDEYSTILLEAKNLLKFRQVLEKNTLDPPVLPEGNIRFEECYTDVPGPDGLPFPNAAWRIVTLDRQSSDLSALVGKPLVEGRTDKKGCVRFDAQQQRLLKQALAEGFTLAWVADSHVVVLDLERPILANRIRLLTLMQLH